MNKKLIFGGAAVLLLSVFLIRWIIYDSASVKQNASATIEETDSSPIVDDSKIEGIEFDVQEKEDSNGNKIFISVIREEIDLEQYAVDYYNKFFHDDAEVHGVMIKLPDGNTSTRIAVEDGKIRVTTHAYFGSEERILNRLFHGQKLHDVYVDVETGAIEVIADTNTNLQPQSTAETEDEIETVVVQPQQPTTTSGQSQQQAPQPTVTPTEPEDNSQLPLKATCYDGTVQYQDHPSLPNYQGMCSGHGGIYQRHGRVP